MTLSIPLSPPDRGPSSIEFELERVDYLSPEANGNIGGVTAGLPLWKMSADIGHLSPDMSDEWRAFFSNLRGSQRLFYGFDYTRRFPRAHPTGISGFSGDASSWSVSVAGDGTCYLTLNGLPAGMILSRGDYVGFRWGSYQVAMVRLTEAKTANGSGVAASVAIEPALPTLVPGGAIAYVQNAVCLMKSIPAETRPGAIGRRGVITGGKLSAIQTYRA